MDPSMYPILRIPGMSPGMSPSMGPSMSPGNSQSIALLATLALGAVLACYIHASYYGYVGFQLISKIWVDYMIIATASLRRPRKASFPNRIPIES